ncbi:MAG TPA: hypothetical protein VMX33_13120 [bacterium]|nr:hypothetical protein [bacterium]
MKRILLVLTCLLSITAASFAQAKDAYMIIDGKGANIDSALSDLLLDKDLYQGKMITLANVMYPEFGFKASKVTFYECAPWFEDSETYRFRDTRMMHNKNLSFYFQPTKTDRDMRKAMLGFQGTYFTNPQAMTISGRFVEHQLYGGLILFLFLVDSFELSGKKYTGAIPDKVSYK